MSAKFPKKHSSKIFPFISIFLFFLYLFLIWSSFRTSLSNVSSTFGYLDYQNNWRGLEEFIRFRVPFKDYFYEYGWFFLFIQTQAYLFFSRSFLAVLISRHFYLPLVGLFLSYVVALNVLRKKHLVLIFLFFLLLFGTNYDYTSARHLMAELSLSFFILFFFNQSEKYLWWSGISGGLAVLTALEYGVALNLTVAAVSFLSFFSARRIIRVYFKKFIFGQLIILLPFFFWLLLTGALRNYVDFTLAFVNNFYYASPCSGDSFPRIENISQLRPTSKLLVFNLPIEFLQQVNFYLVIIFLASFFLFLLIRLIIKRKFSRDDLIKLSLTIYGLVISIRTLDNPCTGYFGYSLVPFFLLLTLLIDNVLTWIKKRKRVGLKTIGMAGIMIIFVWFIITEYTGTLVQIFGKKEAPVKNEVVANEFYAPVGWFIKKDYVRDYQEVVSYIKKNSEKEDFLYVYPWGPYNQLTSRKPPNSLTNALQMSIAGEKFMEMTEKELITKKPKLIVINLFNNLGTVRYGLGRGDVARYFSWPGEEGPAFVGDGSLVERFILTNYRPVLKNDLAVVMELRVEPTVIIEKKKEIFSKKNWQDEEIELVSMKKIGQSNQYAITGKKASWTYLLEKPIEATEFNLDLKLDGNFLTKHLSRFFLNIEVVTADTEEPHLTKSLAWKDWQTVEITFAQQKKIKRIKIEVDRNTGLIWWLNPNYLEIKQIIFYLPAY